MPINLSDSPISVDKAPAACTVRVVDVWSKDAIPVKTGTKQEVADAAWLVEVGASRRWMSADDLYPRNDWASTDEKADQKVVGKATKVGLGLRAGLLLYGPVDITAGQVAKWISCSWLQNER